MVTLWITNKFLVSLHLTKKRDCGVRSMVQRGDLLSRRRGKALTTEELVLHWIKCKQSLMCSLSSTLGEVLGKDLGGALTMEKEGHQEEEGICVQRFAWAPPAQAGWCLLSWLFIFLQLKRWIERNPVPGADRSLTSLVVYSEEEVNRNVCLITVRIEWLREYLELILLHYVVGIENIYGWAK